MPPRLARRARHEIADLSSRTLARASFYEQMTDAISRVVPFEGSCWHTIDPATMLITSHRTEDLPSPETGFPLLCANEYLADDVNKFADLAQAPSPVGVLSRTTGGHPDTSLRYREFLRPNGIDGELRVSFTDGVACWGSLILVRPPGLDFTDEDAEFVASVCRPIALGLRRTLLVDAAARGGGRTAPGMVVVDGRGRIDRITAPARYWLALLRGSLVDDEEWLPPAMHSVVTAVRRAATDGEVAGVRLAVHTESGEWVELHGALVEGGSPDQVAIVLDAASPRDVAPVRLAAAGLTPREREVIALVVHGLATKVIAARLGISTFTAQDHLRAIFEKLGVHSKQELVAYVFFQDQLPQIEQGVALAADGVLED
jgi:DNA-binding CsgD family transcriptional regulator